MFFWLKSTFPLQAGLLESDLFNYKRKVQIIEHRDRDQIKQGLVMSSVSLLVMLIHP